MTAASRPLAQSSLGRRSRHAVDERSRARQRSPNPWDSVADLAWPISHGIRRDPPARRCGLCRPVAASARRGSTRGRPRKEGAGLIIIISISAISSIGDGRRGPRRGPRRATRRRRASRVANRSKEVVVRRRRRQRRRERVSLRWQRARVDRRGRGACASPWRAASSPVKTAP